MSDAAAVLVLHAMGSEDGGGPWRAAFEGVGWAGPVLAPDLPGHGAAPPPPGGCYELADPALVGGRLADEADAPPVVVGVGVSGWAAQILALGGRAAALVLVDGLNGPWVDARTNIRDGVDWLRAVAGDPAAVAPPPPGGPDPRVRHGVVAHGDRTLTERTAAAIAVPVLLVESPGSPLGAADVDELAGRFAAGASVVRVERADPDTVADAVSAWAGSRQRA